MKKFSNVKVLGCSNKAPKGLDLSLLNKIYGPSKNGMVKLASKVVKIAPKEDDFLYVRVRAVSAGNVIEHPSGDVEYIPIDEFLGNLKKYAKKARLANDNGDFFSYEELKDKYKTFIGKSAFVDHNNENVENARGIILDAVWNEKGKFVELLIAVDKIGYPELARGIEIGIITDVSMGCRCGYSICSICGNIAKTEDDFCDHIKYYKGSTYQGLPVFEDNRDIEFFEISFVTTGADKQAKILEKVAYNKANLPTILRNSTNDYLANDVLVKIASEKNQRLCESKNSKISSPSLFEQLNNLPWS